MKQLKLDLYSVEISTQSSKLILEKTKGFKDSRTLRQNRNSNALLTIY